MGTATLVDDVIKHGQKVLDQLTRQGFVVVAAAWLKPVEKLSWKFYIASPLVDAQGSWAAYQEVARVVRSFQEIWIDVTDVVLVGERDYFTVEVLDLIRRYPGRFPCTWATESLGHVFVEGAYIYAPPRPRDAQSDLGLKRLKVPVQQRVVSVDMAAPYSIPETQALKQLEANGINPEQAQSIIWQRRMKERGGRSIPAGTVVKADYAAFWGNNPEEDSNPLLLVEAGDGSKGLVFLDDTEPLA